MDRLHLDILTLIYIVEGTYVGFVRMNSTLKYVSKNYFEKLRNAVLPVECGPNIALDSRCAINELL